MFILIWKKWGILVIPIAGAALLLGSMLSNFLFGHGVSGHFSQRIGFGVTALAGAAIIWFGAMWLAARPPRQMIDPATRQPVLVARDAGHLFFIPTRFWAIALIACGIWAVVSGDRAADAVPIASASQGQ